ncbi:NUDIX domain-containing protein [Jeotgalibacillus sp. R-1-5s-1]|uniref:NUDIX hydrolase n=1 Tax=Jeotgalibacillus sp. R-1-5s-1 TaxID=2555897 RepID=UPI00106A180B|nr:NUDIX domain-containing protein [Jeotgalibacillus sp. R-1-5s-1]TFD93576.1 NUDIX domain-containing protein [Jeotgalibacillus sp. R-1-5s-1]
MRNRGSVILIDQNRIALIKRVRSGQTYYVFPGGGIEPHETPEEAAKREAFEELGIRVELGELFTTDYFDGKQYFYLAHRVSGVFGSGQGDEFKQGDNRGSYEPVWLKISELPQHNVLPEEVAQKLYQQGEAICSISMGTKSN